MIRIGRADTRSDYVLECDRDSDAPTHFVLRRLTSEQLARVVELSPVPIHVAMRVETVRRNARAEERELSAAEREEIDRLLPDDDDALRTAGTATQMGRAAALGIERIRGLVDEHGNAVELTGAEFVERCTNLEWLIELGNAVLAFSSLRDTDRKN